HVDAGHDPRMAAGPGAGGMTVARLVETYLSHPDKSSRRSNAEIARRLRRNVVAKIGDIRITDINRRDVRNVVEPMERRGVSTEAARVFEDVRGMLRWAVQHEFLENNPADGMAKPSGGKPRSRTLSDDEVATLWNGLPAALPRSRQCQRIIK